MQKNIQDICKKLENCSVEGKNNILVSDITADSRAVKSGSLFICLKGAHVDGHKYLKQAAAKGAVAALVEEIPENAPEGMTFIKVDDTRDAMEKVTPYFYDYPGKNMRVIAVTGTNGKTTTTNIIRNVLEEAGHKTGLIGTIDVHTGSEVIVSHNTTPDVVDLQKFLAAMRENGCSHVVMEVSSHALSLKRVAGIDFTTAVLTNVTEDHLDFHKTMEAYRDAKSLLFEGLKEGSRAVFNADDAASSVIEKKTEVPFLTYGMDKAWDIHPVSYKVAAKSMDLLLETPAGKMDLHLNITGRFNMYNVMSAVGALLSEGVDKDTIVKVLNDFAGVPGRFQLVEAGQPYTVIVDYAHTPDGLENVLATARLITDNRLKVVFGCGGDRDNKKRPIMGEIALKMADDVYVTSDNPRTEDPEAIIDEIATVLKVVPEGKTVTRLSDRKEAIEAALAASEKGDLVLIAGKGHENYQILKDETIHFDDREVVLEYLAGKGRD